MALYVAQECFLLNLPVQQAQSSKDSSGVACFQNGELTRCVHVCFPFSLFGSALQNAKNVFITSEFLYLQSASLALDLRIASIALFLVSCALHLDMLSFSIVIGFVTRAVG